MSSTAPLLRLQAGTGCWTGQGLVPAPSSRPGSVTLARYAETWLALAAGRRPRTIAEYRYRLERHVLPRLGRIPLNEITADDLRRLSRELRLEGYAPWTVYSIVFVLKTVLNRAVRQGDLAANPFDRLERSENWAPGRGYRRILNSSEITALLREIPRRHQTLILTAIFAGLRQSELLALQWQHVDAIRGVICIQTALNRQQRHVPLKTAAARREVVIPERLTLSLEDVRRHSPYPGASDYAFPSQVGTPLHWRNVNRRVLQPAVKRAQLGRVRWHDLRHTYVSILIAGGANILFVSRQLGHANPATTLQLYGDLFQIEEQADRAREALGEFMPIG